MSHGILIRERRILLDVHTSPAALPELQAFLRAFQVRFRRPEGREAFERYTTGLLSERTNKHGDTIAQAVPGPSAQRVQAFLTTMQWDEEDRNRQRVQKMIAEASTGDGVLVVDDTGFPKRGTASVGVARQYSGTLGKAGNCQMTVTCCDSERRATWPVAVRVYLPRSWADDPARRQQARVPTAVTFQTKPEIALALRDPARAWGGPHRGVVADADYGANPNFRAGLEERQDPYVVAVRTDFPVRVGGTAASPVWRADELLQSVPRWQWRMSRWRRGTTGWLRKQCVVVRGLVGAEGRATARRVAGGGAIHPGAARGAEVLLEQPVGAHIQGVVAV